MQTPRASRPSFFDDRHPDPFVGRDRRVSPPPPPPAARAAVRPPPPPAPPRAEEAPEDAKTKQYIRLPPEAPLAPANEQGRPPSGVQPISLWDTSEDGDTIFEGDDDL